MTPPRIVAGICGQFQRAGTISRAAASSAVHGAVSVRARVRSKKEEPFMRIPGVARAMFAVFATVIVIVAGVETRTATAQVKQPSLYERLGGTYSIATVVDDFIERLLVNPTLNANPAIKEARVRVPKAGLKFHVTAMVCEASGGPCKYTGRAMKESHQHLNITQAEWDAMVADFRTSLNTFSVPQREQQELITIVGSTRNDIVRPSGRGQP
jgi:hemoglobin